VSIETKLFGQLFQIPSFPLHSSGISYKPYLSMVLMLHPPLIKKAKN